MDIYAISDIYPNRNKCTFPLKSMEVSKNTCYNKPILGSFDFILNDFREHNGEDRYDKEFGTMYWDCSGDKDEKILGVIRESDTVNIVTENGVNWLKISCALWTYYTYQQVKKLLKSKTKKVSVEIMIDQCHCDDKGIMVIDKFTLLGITILGDQIKEGIPGARLNVLDLMKETCYSQQMQCLSFAYNQKDKMHDKDINLNNSFILYNNNIDLGGNRVTYREKMELLTQFLKEQYSCDGDENECGFWLCDFSDEFVIIRDYSVGKFFKIFYSISEDNTVIFDIESKVEQIEAFVDAPAEKVIEINGENKTFSEVVEMYQDVLSKFTDSSEQLTIITEQFNNYKGEYESKKYAVTIDDTEYDIDGICVKYQSELLNKDERIADLNQRLIDVNEQFKLKSEELSTLKDQIRLAEEEKLCKDGKAMVDEEDELDDDDKEDMKKRCDNKQYSSLKDVEDDIAKRLYAKKKNNRQKTFQSNFDTTKNSGVKQTKSVDSLIEYISG